MAKSILEFCLQARKIAELQKKFGYSDRTYFRHNHIQPLLDDGLLEMTIPDKPTSSQQKYRTTAKGLQLLETCGGKSSTGEQIGKQCGK